MKTSEMTKQQHEIRITANCLDYFTDVSDGLRRVEKADFSGLPESPSWHDVLCLGVMIDGYEVGSKITGEHIEAFHRMKEAEFETVGAWSGGVLELWVVLFYYNRKNHWNEGYGFGEGEKGRMLATAAYQALRSRLQSPGETADITFRTA
jgi:hypothetical protein